MVLRVVVLADTMCSVVLGDIFEVFAHPFCLGAFGGSYIFFLAYLASDAINDIVCFAGTAPGGVVAAPCNRAGDMTRGV